MYYRKAGKRLLLLCLLGILYNHGWGTGMPMALDEIRYASVLGRIAIAWFFCAMLVWHTSLRTQIITAAAILVGYWLLLCFVPVPGGSAGDLSAAGSWNAWFDAHLLPGISYQNRVVDPEGVLSNIPAIVNALMGVFGSISGSSSANWRVENDRLIIRRRCGKCVFRLVMGFTVPSK